jgi:hypothetical protein
MTGSFLSPGFPAAAAYHAAGFGSGSALALVGLLHYDSLMHNRFIKFNAKYFFI